MTIATLALSFTSDARRHLAAAVLFLTAISAPLVVSIADVLEGPDGAREERIAQTPSLEVSAESVRRFPGRFKWYFEQRFGLRDTFASLHARLLVDALGVSPTRSVVLGDEGWLFLGSEKVLELYRAGHGFTGAELERWCQSLQARQAWLAERGIPYVVVIAPDKHTLYGEHLPPALRPGTGRTRVDELVDHLRTHSTVRVVDLRPPLRAAASQARLFHKTDTHWNPLGAYVGTAAVLRDLKESAVPQLRPPEVDLGRVRRSVEPPGDLARMISLRERLSEEVLEPEAGPLEVVDAQRRPYRRPELDMPEPKIHELQGTGGVDGTAVVFRDSFGLAMMPYFASHFRRTVFKSTYDLDRALVEQEKPLVVIQQLVERRLMMLELDGFTSRM